MTCPNDSDVTSRMLWGAAQRAETTTSEQERLI